MLLRLPKLPQRPGRGVAVLCDGRQGGEWFQGAALSAMRADGVLAELRDADVWLDRLSAKMAAGKRADRPGKLKQIAWESRQYFSDGYIHRECMELPARTIVPGTGLALKQEQLLHFPVWVQ